MTLAPSAACGWTTPPTAKTWRRSPNARCDSTRQRGAAAGACGRDVVAWVATGFDVLASRVVGGRVRPADLSAGADALLAGLPAMDSDGFVDPGFGMDSAWRGVLPPETGFVHLDDVPARVVLDLAQRGRRAGQGALQRARPAGVAAGSGGRRGHARRRQRRDPDAVRIRLDGNGFPAADAGRAMQFAPESVSADEVVRVRVLPAWLRVDARFGTVYRRRGDPAVVLR